MTIDASKRKKQNQKEQKMVDDGLKSHKCDEDEINIESNIYSEGESSDNELNDSRFIDSPYQIQSIVAGRKIVFPHEPILRRGMVELEEDDCNPYYLISLLPTIEELDRQLPPNKRKPALPAKSQSDARICLAIDLDETLVHCNTEPMNPCDKIIKVESNGFVY
ncbi:MAG: hypothetical protein EZS28_053998, partial [Streblomastix strix]